MNLHWCLLDKECREFSPPRLYITTVWFSGWITLPPLYRELDWDSTKGERSGIPILTGKKKWAWEWGSVSRPKEK